MTKAQIATSGLLILSAALVVLMTVRSVRFVLAYIRREKSPEAFGRHAFWLLGYALATMNVAVICFSVGIFPWYWTLVLLLYSAITLTFEVSAKKTFRRLSEKEERESERLMRETLDRTSRKNFDQVRDDVRRIASPSQSGQQGQQGQQKKLFTAHIRTDDDFRRPASQGRSVADGSSRPLGTPSGASSGANP